MELKILCKQNIKYVKALYKYTLVSQQSDTLTYYNMLTNIINYYLCRYLSNKL